MKTSKLLSRIVIAVLSFCMVFGMISLVACGTSGDDGVITLSDTSIEVQVGKTKRLTGTITVDGAKLTWSSADESIATVSDVGLVKGIKTGKTTVTATYENYSASCEVNVIDVVTVELNKTTLALNVGEDETLTATASNGGTIKWSSSDASIAKVENGKVTGLKGGTATIYAECAGTRADCEVTVTDLTRIMITSSVEADITETDRMYYFGVEGGKASEEDMYYSIADETYHATFTNGGSWFSFQLFYKHDVEGADNNVSFKLTSNKSGHITVCGHTIALQEGENLVSIDGFTGMLSIQFGENNGQVPDIVGEIEISLSELTFTAYTPEKLATPTGLTVDAATKTVTVTDTNGNKAQSYRVVFYDDSNKKVSEVTVGENGKIDDGAIANGTYTLAVYAYSTGKYTSSDEYKPDPAITYTVNNESIEYSVEFKAEAAIEDTGKWYYWKEWGTVTANVLNDKLTIDFSDNGSNWYNVQLFYVDPVVDKTKDNKVTFTLKSDAAGHITVNGNVIEIKAEDVGKAVEYTVYNIGAGKATVSIQMGVESPKTIDIQSAHMEFTFSNPVAAEYQKAKLAAPTVALGEDYAYTITDTNAAANVDGYNLVLYNGETKVTTIPVTEKTGTIDTSMIATGTYTVKAVALGSGLYSNSDESAGVEISVTNEAGVVYELAFGQAADDEWGNKGLDTDGKFYYWNDQGWAGANVTMNDKATYIDGTITLKYTCTENGTGFAVQLFCKDTTLTAGKQYTLTLKVNVTVATTVTVNGKEQALTAGDNEITVTFTAEAYTQPGGACSFSMQIAAKAGEDNATNTVIISDIEYTEVTE